MVDCLFVIYSLDDDLEFACSDYIKRRQCFHDDNLGGGGGAYYFFLIVDDT